MHPVLTRSLDDLIDERGSSAKLTERHRAPRGRDTRYPSGHSRKYRELSPRKINYGPDRSTDLRRTVTYDDHIAQSHRSVPRSFRGYENHSLGSSITISNLHFEVSEQDLKELFESIGPVTKASIDYDRAGRSNGTATVYFKRYEDAYSARERFQNVPLDGKPMQIELQRRAKFAPKHQNRGGGITLRNHRHNQPDSGKDIRMDLDDELDHYMMSDTNKINK
jgi:THO complex subunit 4